MAFCVDLIQLCDGGPPNFSLTVSQIETIEGPEMESFNNVNLWKSQTGKDHTNRLFEGAMTRSSRKKQNKKNSALGLTQCLYLRVLTNKQIRVIFGLSHQRLVNLTTLTNIFVSVTAWI